MERIKNYAKRNKIKTILFVGLLIGYYFCLPKKLFTNPTSTVVTSNNDELLGAVIASDGQWRFPELDSIPSKFKHCILQFEDAHFYKHFGFNPVSIVKALKENYKAKRVVRGGSTITQQVIRLSRKNQRRSYFEKLVELILATRLEFRSSKEEILRLYASHAPFGGNVVGLEMAAWRYFGLHPYQLSWAESATLAVLPNAPSLIYPGKNQEHLRVKRNTLLKKLFTEGIIDQETYELATEEELPQKPYPLPTVASHFIQEVAKTKRGQRIKSSINIHLQKQINTLAKQHYEQMKQNEVYNLAVLVLDVETRKVLSYVGNSPTDGKHQKDVNNIVSPRSTGSTLKPFLYAQMLQEGALLPTQLVVDIPTEIAGYSPKNFDLTFDGAVPANEALTRSLNIPAVRMLQSYGLEKFREDIKAYHIKHINKSSDYYGLSLILGGAEASLWDLCKTFAGYAGIVNHYEELRHEYYTNEFLEPSILHDNELSFGAIKKEYTTIDAGTAYSTLNTLTEVNRPLTDQAWKYYDSSQKIAWKTGTSFGNKDAWAIGATSKYVVGVWVGNSDGEGRSNLTGVGSAAPLMFNVFDVLPSSEWFLEPFEDLYEEEICTKSGYLALPICPSEKQKIPKNGRRADACPYHKEIAIDITEKFRVNSNCESVSNIKTKEWFVLPPLMAHYYQQKNADYRPLPSFRKDCLMSENNSMEFLFPTKYKSTVSLTKNSEGKINSLILKVTHQNSNAKVYWYLDDTFIGITQDYHEQEIQPKPGVYTIKAIDNFGNERSCIIELR
ncbi:penicillin-binding protein 1C [Tenacibaculum sp. MAR_2009_124]|uniref:penicillin-binding protein 1C n=1 Tax=Tenacibaculum sp. MAR_2009_124 TaxID=1250059 RepID=UPI00089D91E7|nr:penicillin-binding protein 1C [Tenacibaculum sp. MAR_2009_124]SEB51186.1 penicillin-binding protein 1C [Tenacibaculum sp. MAR_2009_124]